MTRMDYRTIRLELNPPLATVTLNRPDRLNAFSHELVYEVIRALDGLKQDDTIRAVILCGAGKAFSAGYDIKGDDGDFGARGIAGLKKDLQYCWDYAFAIWRFPKPIVAQVHGYCLAGACEIAMLCDLTIASDDAVFGEPEIRFATGPPALIMPWVVPMKIAKELIYTGKFIKAQRAYEIGMVNEVVGRDQLERRARYHALLISKVAPLAVQLAKEAINHTYEIQGLVSAFANNANLVAIMDGTETEENRIFEQIRKEKGLRAALDWRDKHFDEVERELAHPPYGGLPTGS
jgi:enoyl-CoA hydratase/carnithine racemase